MKQLEDMTVEELRAHYKMCQDYSKGIPLENEDDEWQKICYLSRLYTQLELKTYKEAVADLRVWLGAPEQ